jgi:Putative MetA-pathway of phenol degradation
LSLRILIAAACLSLTPAAAAAQQTVSDVLGFLVTNQAVPTEDFERDRAAAEAARDTITRALLVNLTSVPVATSSSGFLYRLNPELGTVERATETFGGFFVERALTPGSGRASFGISATTSSFDRLDGRELRDGTLLTVANTFRDEPAPFDTESLTLRLRSSTMTVFGSIGLTDRLEVGGAIPFVRMDLEGQRINIYRGETFLQASGSATASGLADIALRGKYTVLSGRKGGVAAAAELRLPTGDETHLLGAGSSSYRLMAIGSFEEGRLGLHGNAALVRGGVSDELDFMGAALFAVSPRVTISGELLARHLPDLAEILLSSQPHPTSDGVDTLRLVPGAGGGTTLATAIAGVKWNVTGTLVLGAHVAWPMGERGLTAPITPRVALEYAF